MQSSTNVDACYPTIAPNTMGITQQRADAILLPLGRMESPSTTTPIATPTLTTLLASDTVAPLSIIATAVQPPPQPAQPPAKFVPKCRIPIVMEPERITTIQIREEPSAVHLLPAEIRINPLGVPKRKKVTMGRVRSVDEGIGVWLVLPEFGAQRAFLPVHEVSMARKGQSKYVGGSSKHSLKGVHENDEFPVKIKKVAITEEGLTTIDVTKMDVDQKDAEECRTRFTMDQPVRDIVATVVRMEQDAAAALTGTTTPDPNDDDTDDDSNPSHPVEETWAENFSGCESWWNRAVLPLEEMFGHPLIGFRRALEDAAAMSRSLKKLSQSECERLTQAVRLVLAPSNVIRESEKRITRLVHTGVEAVAQGQAKPFAKAQQRIKRLHRSTLAAAQGQPKSSAPQGGCGPWVLKALLLEAVAQLKERFGQPFDDWLRHFAIGNATSKTPSFLTITPTAVIGVFRSVLLPWRKCLLELFADDHADDHHPTDETEDGHLRMIFTLESLCYQDELSHDEPIFLKLFTDILRLFCEPVSVPVTAAPTVATLEPSTCEAIPTLSPLLAVCGQFGAGGLGLLQRRDILRWAYLRDTCSPLSVRWCHDLHERAKPIVDWAKSERHSIQWSVQQHEKKLQQKEKQRVLNEQLQRWVAKINQRKLERSQKISTEGQHDTAKQIGE